MCDWQGFRKATPEVTPGIDLRLAHERAGLSTEMDDPLNSFAPERERTVPLFAGHSTHAPLASDIPFIIHPPPVPLAPQRAARGRARTLALLLLVGLATWGAYEYELSRTINRDTLAVWTSRLASLVTPPAVPAAAPVEALPLDPPPTDSRVTSTESAVLPEPDRTADAGRNTSTAAIGEIGRPAVAPPAAAVTLKPTITPAQGVSGDWRLDTQMEAGDSSLQGVKLRYEVTLKQDGDRVAGVGTKISENENGIAPAAQTPVTMSGTIAGDRLTLNYVELGTQPETRGRIVLLVDGAGTLRGRFSSSATPPSGHIEAHRVTAGQ